MEQYIPLVTKTCIKRIPLGEIIYIMKKHRKILIVTDRQRYEFYEKMDKISQLLDRRFYACLQGLVVNLDKVEQLANQTIFFQNGETISMGRDTYVKMKQYYAAYLKNLYKI